MILKFTLSENDYFQFLLYTTSVNKEIKKKELIKRISSFFFYGLVLLAFLRKELYDFAILFGFIILVDVFFYASREKKEKFKNMRIAANDSEGRRIDKTFTVILDNETEFVQVTEFFRDAKNKLRGLEGIVEVGKYFYILFVNEHLIIPKQSIDDEDALRCELKMISGKYSIGFKSDLNWRW